MTSPANNNFMPTTALNSVTAERLRYYLDNIEVNADTLIPERVYAEMRSVARGLGDRRFCRAVLVALVGLKDVIPICVSLHAVAVDIQSSSGSSHEQQRQNHLHRKPGLDMPRIFKLRMEEKREMIAKPTNLIPNRRGSKFAEVANWVMRRWTQRGDTVYYNMGSAGRSTSYHLHVEGPENTYYARGSLVRENTEDRRDIYASQVEMQKRCGQRNAHIYIRSGHRMVNVAFMFRFRKAPLDSYHIMFVAALLCSAVLGVCLMGSLGDGTCPDENGSSIGFSAVSMLLAVVSAAGSWIYGRAWDGREESSGIMVSVILIVACSVAGMFLYGASAAGYVQSEPLQTTAIIAWCVILSVMLCVSTLLGYASLLHGSIYRYLLAKVPSPGSGGSESDRILDDSELGVEVIDGVRCDTPQGRYVTNDYCLWTRSLRRFEEQHGIKRSEYSSRGL